MHVGGLGGRLARRGLGVMLMLRGASRMLGIGSRCRQRQGEGREQRQGRQLMQTLETHRDFHNHSKSANFQL
jgi:hypothetical protein